MLECYEEDFVTKHLGEIFKGLYLTDSVEKYTERETFENVCVEITKDIYLLVVRKGHRCLRIQ